MDIDSLGISMQELQSEFDVSEEPNIHELLDKLDQKLSGYGLLIEGVLQPDSTLVSLQESGSISDQTRAELFSFFKKLMFMRRKKKLIELKPEEHNEFFKEYFAFYKNHKSDFENVVKLTMHAWENEEQKVDTERYFG